MVDERTGGKDLRLLRRAVKNGWNVSEAAKKLIVDEMTLLVAGRRRGGSDKEVSDREKIQAAKVLVTADGIDARLQIATEQQGPQVNVGVNIQADPFAVYKQVMAAEQQIDRMIEAKLHGPIAEDPGAGQAHHEANGTVSGEEPPHHGLNGKH